MEGCVGRGGGRGGGVGVEEEPGGLIRRRRKKRGKERKKEKIIRISPWRTARCRSLRRKTKGRAVGRSRSEWPLRRRLLDFHPTRRCTLFSTLPRAPFPPSPLPSLSLSLALLHSFFLSLFFALRPWDPFKNAPLLPLPSHHPSPPPRPPPPPSPPLLSPLSDSPDASECPSFCLSLSPLPSTVLSLVPLPPHL